MNKLRSEADLHSKDGFTLFELLIAMLLLAMVSVMIYSVLNVGIKFSAQGGEKILAMERKYGFLNLLQSQIKSAVYGGDQKDKKLLISADDDIFRLVTRNPFRYPDAGVVLAIYRFSESEGLIYYTEKRDYYNTDYDDEYVPDFDDMFILARDEESFSVQYEGLSGPEVTVEYRGEEFTLVPKCADEQAMNKLLEAQ